jgi:uncharacterized UPF0160 family protein
MMIATHNSSFHADDVFGVAILLAIHRCEFVRTRDPITIAAADFAVDVGGIWDPSTGRFDHHQKGFCGQRESGVMYASAGLVWREYGVVFIRNLISAESLRFTTLRGLDIHDTLLSQIAKEIDDELIQYVDMADTGAQMSAPGFFGLSAILSQFNQTWLSDRFSKNDLSEEDAAIEMELGRLERFENAMYFVSTILENAISNKISEYFASEKVRAAERIENGQILVLKDGNLPWTQVVCNEMPDVKFVIYPESSENQFRLRIVPLQHRSFVARMKLPMEWAGLRDHALAEETGVADAVFCHNGLFIAGAVSFEGVLALANLALKNKK